MHEPNTPEEILEDHKILRSDPQRYLQMINDRIAANPNSPHGYFSRHQAWMRLDQPTSALADLDRSIALDPKPTAFWSRANVNRHVGEYEKAIEDYSRREAIDPEQWSRDAFPLIYQADTYARLGDEPMALAYCARLPDDFWTPGHHDLPPGGKIEIADELRRRAAAARQARMSGSPPV